MLSNNAICFEGICRIYRNAVVSHIRDRMNNRYPDDWQERIALPFGKEWKDLRQNAKLRRLTGEISSQLSDDADLLGVNHFRNLFDKYFDDLFSETEASEEIARKQEKQAVLGWSQNIKNLRDPALGHPGDVDLTDEDALQMLDFARRILDKLDSDAASNVSSLWDQIRERTTPDEALEVSSRRTLEGSLLPSRESIAPRFIGRQTELEQLNQWLNDENSRLWLLAGDGGKGKSAIAYQFAADTKNDPPANLEIVIWLSAKIRQFNAGILTEIDAPDFWDLGSAIDGVLFAYGATEAGGSNIDEKNRICMEYLANLPALIVLDDVDSLEGPGISAMNFFQFEVLKTPSKILLTSRRIPFGMEPMTTRVHGFTPESGDGFNFIQSRLKIYGLDAVLFSHSVMNRILESCDGSPLYIQDLLRLCIVGVSPSQAIERWQSTDGENARRYALEREFELLSTEAKKVLLTCALYPGPASLPAILAAAELPESTCLDAIRELQGLFLMPRPEISEGVSRFSLDLNTRRLVREVQGNTDLARRVTSSINALTGQIQATGEQRKRIGQYVSQAVSQVKLDRHTDAEKTLTDALQAYPSNTDLHGVLGWVYKTWKPSPRYSDARNSFERATQLGCSKEDTYWHWAAMEQAQSEWTAAAEAAEKGLDHSDASTRLRYMAGFARSQLAKDLYQQALYSRAEQEARKAEGYLRDALLDLDDVEPGQYQSHSRIHRASVINYEYLVKICHAQNDGGSERHFLRLLSTSLDRWANEHPGDPNASSEKQRLLWWFPDLRDGAQ